MDEVDLSWVEPGKNHFQLAEKDYAIIMGIYIVRKEIDGLFLNNPNSNLSPVQIEVLSALFNGQCETSTELAHRLRVSKANITGVLNRLEAKGYLTRKESEEDARIKIITITKKGEKEVNKVIPEFLDVMTKSISGLNEKEKNAVINTLGKMYRSLSAINENQ